MSRLRIADFGLWKRLQKPKTGSRNDTGLIIDGDLLLKLERLSLAIGRDLLGGLMGEHVAVRKTQGIEFADFRPYSAGDDLRRVDWNAYARLGTLHVRQSQAELDTVLYLLLDASPSMAYGRPDKFLSARRLASALGYIALAHLDDVVLAVPGGERSAAGDQGSIQSAIRNPQSTIVCRGRAESANLFRYLQGLRPGPVAEFNGLLTDWSTRTGQGKVAVLISDLLLDGYREGVHLLVGSGFRVNVLHLLSPDELRPPDAGDLELIDSETGQRMEVHVGPSGLAEYDRRLNAWLDDTREWCRSTGVGYVLLQSDWDVERVLLETLRRQGVTA